MRPRLTTCLFSAASLLPVAALAQSYSVAINQPASNVTYTIGLSAPFATTPPLPQNGVIPTTTSYLIGGAAAVPPTTPATRTRPASCIICGNFSGNWPVAITAGSISANVTSGTTPLHPSGAFNLAIAPGPGGTAGTCTVSGTDLNLLGGTTVPFTVGVSVGFQAFQTNSPTSTFLIPGTTVPVNQNATVTSIVGAQAAPAAGTLTPTGTPGIYAFAAPVTLVLTVAANQNGAPVPVPPQEVVVAVAGTIDTNQTAAPVTGTINISTSQVVPGPTALDPLTFPEPIYGGQLLAFIVIASQTVNVTADATLAGVATRLPDPNPVDFNNDGTVDADDLADFINAFFGQPPDPRTDFNHDGSLDADDLGDYINAFFA